MLHKKQELEALKLNSQDAMQIKEEDVDSDSNFNQPHSESHDHSPTHAEKQVVADPDAQRHYITCLKEYNKFKMQLGTRLPEFNE